VWTLQDRLNRQPQAAPISGETQGKSARGAYGAGEAGMTEVLPVSGYCFTNFIIIASPSGPPSR